MRSACAFGGGWFRWCLFGFLAILGVYYITAYVKAPFLVLLSWMAFGMLWIPAAYYLSRKVSGLFFLRSATAESTGPHKPLGFKPRCPNCKAEVAMDQTLCHNCYEDLLYNCQECGRVINAPHKVCRECASKHRGRKLRIKGL